MTPVTSSAPVPSLRNRRLPRESLEGGGGGGWENKERGGLGAEIIFIYIYTHILYVVNLIVQDLRSVRSCRRVDVSAGFTVYSLSLAPVPMDTSSRVYSGMLLDSQ